MAPDLSNCRVLKEEPLDSSDAKWTQLKKYAPEHHLACTWLLSTAKNYL